MIRDEAAEEDLPPSTGRCAVRELSGTDDKAIVRAYVEPDVRVLIVPVLVCTIRSQLANSQLPESLVNCIVRDARRELTTGALGRRLDEHPADLGILDAVGGERFGERLAQACVRKLDLSSA